MADGEDRHASPTSPEGALVPPGDSIAQPARRAYPAASFGASATAAASSEAMSAP
jgi:hypothetical protein